MAIPKYGPKNRYELTPRHRARLDEWRDKWIAIALRTSPMTEDDRTRVTRAMRGMYRAAKLTPPKREVFASSPMSAAIAAGVAAGAWWIRDHAEESRRLFGRDIGEAELMACVPIAASLAVRAGMGLPVSLPGAATSFATRDATSDATRAATSDATSYATDAATSDATFVATDAATRVATSAATRVATSDATRDAARSATDAATSGATDAATRAATSAATRDATSAATRDATSDATTAATYAATSAATSAATRDATSDATTAATYAATEAATEAATSDATSAATTAATGAATRDATDDATTAATRAATDDATGDATSDATSAATSDATYAATRAATEAAADDAADAATRAATSAATYDATTAATSAGNAVVAFLLRCVGLSYRMRNGGNQWAGWCAYLSFFDRVARLGLPEHKAWRHYEQAAVHGGPRYVHERFWVASDFPVTVGRDEQNRPHCEDGPQLAWRDGWTTWYLHGVRVPRDVVMHPERITVDAIHGEQNAEVRRIMIERYGLGRYVRDAQFEVLDADLDPLGQPRRLLRRDDVMVVELTNSTVDADGTRRVYHVAVEPELRPLLPNGQLGEPQKLTAKAAVASTYGLRAEEYVPEVET